MSPPPEGPILVVESDRRLGDAIAEQLLADGYRVEVARTARHARVLARRSAPQLAVLGAVDAPRGALGLLEEIRGSANGHREWDPGMPAMLLAAPSRELDALRAFEAGADDFICRPAGYLELRGFISNTGSAEFSSTDPALGRAGNPQKLGSARC